MYRYTVVDTDASKRLIALRDDAGRYHVACCRSLLPEVDFRLLGDLPALGIALLLDTSGKVYRMVFSRINCDQVAVFDQMHGVSSHLAGTSAAKERHA
jgi:hypothetical protein